MQYLIIAFRSRNDALTIRSILLNNKIMSETVNTPMEIAKSCGISLKINSQNKNATVSLISSIRKPPSYIGTFLISEMFGERVIDRLA